MKEIITTSDAPGAIGPYSQGVKANGFVFVSGQLPIDPATGDFPSGGIEEQTKQSLENITAILRRVGCGLQDVVKTTVFLSDMKDFTAMNKVYAAYFHEDCPGRSAVQVAQLPKNAMVEIEAIACISD
ncbi:MAG: RidA family protein [Lachnospiraceae bacterium]|jgi:2-iminobutanoate/2-iminopropanoate deaminase|nr:RidA family protein [Lachnospiraceae bacterium]